ncbi:MAG: hypothetical protein HQ494_01680 [Rhodospirillales bacterium]|nr:hypothetical protein [Rhodospirillales bacterium]
MNPRLIRLYILSLAVGAVVLFAVIGGALLMPGVRYQAFRAASELPAIASYFLLRKSVVQRDFTGAGQTLQRQLGWATSWDVEQSVLLPGLIENTKFALSGMRFKEDFRNMRPYLENLAEAYPKLFLPQLWLGETYARIAPEKAFAPLEKAVKIAGTDARPYRAAIDAALGLGDTTTAIRWCQAFKNEQLGGTHPYNYNTLFVGTGMRKIMIVADVAGAPSVMIENDGLALNERRDYSFSLPATMAIDHLDIHFGVPKGVIVEIHSVTLKSMSGEKYMTPESLIITSRDGFSLGEDRFMLMSDDDDQITLRWSGNASIDMDRIDLAMTITRPALATLESCR